MSFMITFKNVGELFISDLEFVGCGYETPQHVGGINAALKIHDTHSLTLKNITVRDSYGYGLLALNTLGDTTIINSKFYRNGGRLKAIKGVSKNGVGGNALFIFRNMLPMYHVHIHITISNSEFAHGTEFYDEDEPGVTWRSDQMWW